MIWTHHSGNEGTYTLLVFTTRSDDIRGFLSFSYVITDRGYIVSCQFYVAPCLDLQWTLALRPENGVILLWFMGSPFYVDIFDFVRLYVQAILWLKTRISYPRKKDRYCDAHSWAMLILNRSNIKTMYSPTVTWRKCIRHGPIYSWHLLYLAGPTIRSTEFIKKFLLTTIFPEVINKTLTKFGR